jgi:TPR repeat protein
VMVMETMRSRHRRHAIHNATSTYTSFIWENEEFASSTRAVAMSSVPLSTPSSLIPDVGHIDDAEDHYNFGRCLEEGIGVDRDLVGAIECYRICAEQRNALGQCMFGRCLERGVGIYGDLVCVAEHYWLSAEQRN